MTIAAATRCLPLVVLLAAGCRTVVDAPPTPPAPRAPAPSASPAPSPRPELPDSLHWFRNSAERRALSLQAYRLATERIEAAARSREAGAAWAVVLDVDETVLDNSGYEVELLAHGATHTEELWSQWVARQSCPAIPGAAAFIARVRALGGRVALVSNRSEAECADTGRNLEAVGIAYDAILCKPADTDDKGPRFARVSSGAAFADDGKPVDVVLWVGDNIKDFPGMSQAVRGAPEDAFAPFGYRFIVLPNPMYGSWESNPRE